MVTKQKETIDPVIWNAASGKWGATNLPIAARRREDQRHQQQKSERQHPGERDDVAADQLQKAIAVGSFDAPDRIQRLLELGHDTDGGEQQCANAENRR
jgi:hypothetical protein